LAQKPKLSEKPIQHHIIECAHLQNVSISKTLAMQSSREIPQNNKHNTSTSTFIKWWTFGNSGQQPFSV